MKPVITPETNKVYRLIGGTAENDLPLEATVDQVGRPVLRSSWALDDEDRALLEQGGLVELVVWGEGTPPVGLAVRPAPSATADETVAENRAAPPQDR